LVISMPALRRNSSIAKCPEVPTPDEACVRPGGFRAAATTSAIVRYGWSGPVNSTVGEV
jgi:hypothetical protein